MKAESNGAERAVLPAEGFVDETQLLKIIPVSHDTLRRMTAAGTFPRPIRISKRLKAWSVRSVRAYIESLEAKA
ncbi:helix-turn-helix transcriptional regulator [Paraburkholderia terrae]|uniref:helix-turn-helix transcriptional regulator n=1 Tax=Paraburkholderia terrae TaxID=311230 RepID=UPI0020679B63|nr:hypothetical protein [Paraburkholderia terrae]BDC38936.1 hypothetical protein PTKU15_22330 [Paraburkholderia terrae]